MRPLLLLIVAGFAFAGYGALVMSIYPDFDGISYLLGIPIGAVAAAGGAWAART